MRQKQEPQREWRGYCRFGQDRRRWRDLRFIVYKTNPKVNRRPIQKSLDGFGARVGKPQGFSL